MNWKTLSLKFHQPTKFWRFVFVLVTKLNSQIIIRISRSPYKLNKYLLIDFTANHSFVHKLCIIPVLSCCAILLTYCVRTNIHPFMYIPRQVATVGLSLLFTFSLLIKYWYTSDNRVTVLISDSVAACVTVANCSDVEFKQRIYISHRMVTGCKTEILQN
jgi:hypothetical protein